MRILMLPSFYGGISYWRFETPAKYLRAAGVEVDCPTADQLEHAVRRAQGFQPWLASVMPSYDLVHVGYTGEPEFAKAFFVVRDACGVPVVTDIDDNLNNVPLYNRGWKAFRPGGIGQRVVKTQLRHSDGVTFSTTPLAQELGSLNPENCVLGNWIDPDTWDHPTEPQRAQDKTVRLFLAGGNGRYGDWGILEDPLKRVLDKYDGTSDKPLVKLLVMGATPVWLRSWLGSPESPEGTRVFSIHPTQSVGLYAQIARYVKPDIWLAPVLKNEFNTCKSDLKFQEAALTDAVFLCTDYPTYGQVPAGTCIKVDNTFAQWTESLEALIESRDLRSRLADAAKEHVLATCTADAYIQPRLEFYQRIVEVCRASSRHQLERERSLHQEPAH